MPTEGSHVQVSFIFHRHMKTHRHRHAFMGLQIVMSFIYPYNLKTLQRLYYGRVCRDMCHFSRLLGKV